MIQAGLYTLVAGGLAGIAVYGLITQAHLLRRILALNLLGNAVFLLLVALARRGPQAADPIPHAMVLTGIVIAVSATAFALALVRCYHGATGAERLPEDEG
ncbi:MAG: sodium:proton antiporter [Halomonas sp.]